MQTSHAPGTPLFSIITPAYEAAAKLEATFATVFAQKADLYEYLVIDGGSADGTIDLLRRNQDRIRWISEPDRGVYDAMNKGIERSRGRYLYFLGAGDLLQPRVLEAVAERVPAHDCGVVYGNFKVPNDDTIYYGDVGKLWLYLVYDLCHQSIFYGREVFELHGPYNLKYPIRADYELNLMAFNDRRIEVRYIDLLIAEFERGGLSQLFVDEVFTRDFPEIFCRGLGWPPVIGRIAAPLLRLRFNAGFREFGRRFFQRLRHPFGTYSQREVE
jgi:glycosyltransferase involved in cell wall biosynthesis